MKKTYSTLKFNWILCLILFLTFLFGLCLLLTLFLPKYHEPGNVFEYISLALLVICILVSLFAFLISYQVVYIDEKGIKFKSLLMVHAKIKWTEISKIEVMNKKSLSSSVGVNIYYQWIEIFTQSEIKQKGFKFSSPFSIIYNNRNVSMIIEAIGKYAKNVDISSIIKTKNKKPEMKWLK